MLTSLPESPLPDRNPVVELLALRGEPDLARLYVAGLGSIADLLPRAQSGCGIYVLSFATGEHYVGQTINVVARFLSHRKTWDDIVEVHFWPVPRPELNDVETAEIHRLQGAGLLLRNVRHAVGRLGPSDLDAIVTVADQQRWLIDGPSDDTGADVRPDRPDLRRLGRNKFAQLCADARYGDLVHALRRYVAATIPFPRRTELRRWSISALPSTNKSTFPRLLTLTVHSLETLYVSAPVGEQARTTIVINVDRTTLLKHWETLEDLMDQFSGVFVREAGYDVRPNVVALRVDGARNLMRVLELPGVLEAARQLNLDLVRKGPSFQWQHHNFDLADRLLEPEPAPDVEPVDAEGSFQLGMRYDQVGDFDRAEAAYLLASRLSHQGATEYLANLYTERGDPEQAELFFSQLGQAGPAQGRRSADSGAAEALHLRGMDCEEDEDLVSAEHFYRRAIDAGRTSTLIHLGDLLAEQDESEWAAAAYLDAAQAGHPRGWFGLGLLYAVQGDIHQAEEFYRRAVDAGVTEAMVYLGALLADRGELRQAEALYRRAVARRDSDAMISLGGLLADKGDSDAAEALYRRAAKRGNVEGLVSLGILFTNLDDPEQAETCFHAAIDAGHPEARRFLGEFYLEYDDLAAAEHQFLVAVDDGDDDAFNHLGLILQTRGDLPGAEQRFRRAADAGNTDAMNNLAWLLVRRGDFREAEPLLRYVAETGDPVAMHSLGYLLQQRKAFAEAEAWYRRAIDGGNEEAVEDLAAMPPRRGRG